MVENIKKVLHTGISVNNMEESVAWYEKFLGFHPISDAYAPPLGARIVFIRRDDLDYEIELFRYDAPKPIPADRLMPNSDLQTVGTKHVAFLVDDMDALKRDFVAGGVDIALLIKNSFEFIDVLFTDHAVIWVGRRFFICFGCWAIWV